MIFDGMTFRRRRSIVALPKEMWEGTDKNCVTFGRACRKDAKGAVQTAFYWNGPSPFGDEPEGGQQPAYAIPIEPDGHSLTNLMYDKQGNAYLLIKSRVYVRGKKAKRALKRKC